MCIHRFARSDPDRGYHDHPWKKAISFIMCGGYEERILKSRNTTEYNVHQRNRWSFSYLNGVETFHRVMIEEGKDAWTLFLFGKRSKTWGMVGLDGQFKQMSSTVEDQDGGWWQHVQKGLGLHEHLIHRGRVIAAVDTIVKCNDEILLIKRGKDPHKGKWAFPGGRIEQSDSDIETAARRELAEETSIKDVPQLKHIATIGNNIRDDRGFCLTCVYLVELESKPAGIRAGDDAVDYDWFNINQLPDMAFDHKDIVDRYVFNKNE